MVGANGAYHESGQKETLAKIVSDVAVMERGIKK